MILLKCILTLFYQRHFSSPVVSRLQVDYFSLVRQNIQLAMLLLLLSMRLRITCIKKLK